MMLSSRGLAKFSSNFILETLIGRVLVPTKIHTNTKLSSIADLLPQNVSIATSLSLHLKLITRNGT